MTLTEFKRNKLGEYAFYYTKIQVNKELSF